MNKKIICFMTFKTTRQIKYLTEGQARTMQAYYKTNNYLVTGRVSINGQTYKLKTKTQPSTVK